MDYKKKYEEAMLRMNKWVEGSEIIDPKEVAEFVFPELKESKDERIRKELIDYCHERLNTTYGALPNIETIKRWLTWLEKQGKSKEVNLVELLKHYPRETELYSPLYGKLWLAEVNEEHGIITCYKYPLEEGCTRAILEQEDTVSFYSNGSTGLPDFNVSKDCMLFLHNNEKQGEQKPTDKVEPKFKVGDWVVYEKNMYQIHNIGLKKYYECLRIDGTVHTFDFKYIDSKSRLWTIQDAKDGDVLATDNGGICIFDGTVEEGKYPFAYCGVTERGFEFYDGKLPFTHANVQPATKEQRDQLEKAMADAGYTFDFEKKELKKIEQEEDVELTNFESALFSAFSDAWQEYLSGKEVNVAKWAREHSAELLEVAREQKPDWSEEDEVELNNIIDFLDDPSTAKFCPKLRSNAIDWLKFLKERVRPQTKQEVTWSEEDEKMFRSSRCYSNEFGNWLSSKNEEKSLSVYKACDWLKSLEERMKGE